MSRRPQYSYQDAAASYSAARYTAPAEPRRSGAWRAVFVVSLIVLAVALAVLGAIVYQYWSQQRAYEELEQYVQISVSDTQVEEPQSIALSDLTVDWDALRAINSDIVGWIYIPDTPINYPVVQGNDNEEYLHKSFDGTTGWLALCGVIFLDYNSSDTFSDRNSALYGHNMNDGSMFACIADWVDSDQFNQHRDVYLLTPQGNYHLKTFALVKTVGTDAIVQTQFSSEESYRSYIQDKLDRSVVTQAGDVLGVDDIEQSLILSTCEYSQTDGRGVLFCSVVETTVANDPYVRPTTDGQTSLTEEQDEAIASEYKEAA